MKLVALPLLALALLLVSAAFVFARPAATDALAPRVEVPPGRIALDRIVRPARGAKLALAPRRATRTGARSRPTAQSEPPPPPAVQALPVGVSPSVQAAPEPPPPAPVPDSPAPPPPPVVELPPAPEPPPPAPEPPAPPALEPPPPPAPEPPPPAPEPQPPAPEPPPPAPEPQPPAPEPPPPAPEPPPPAPEPPPPSDPPPEPLIDAGFESGLDGWNTAGVGEVLPVLTDDIVRDGELAATVRLTGDLDRSELILGGSGSSSTAGTVRFYEGDEYWYAFSFFIQSMVYGEPGAHNLIMQFKGSDSGSPYFGLQLWDYAGNGGSGGGRGLWSHGKAMDGDRFLAPVPEQEWHDVVIHFKASSVDAGFYELYLNGVLIDARSGVSMIPPTATHAYIKDGLYRNGTEIPGTSEIRLDAARLGTTRESVLP